MSLMSSTPRTRSTAPRTQTYRYGELRLPNSVYRTPHMYTTVLQPIPLNPASTSQPYTRVAYTPHPHTPYPCSPHLCSPHPCSPHPCSPHPCSPHPCSPHPCSPHPCSPHPCSPHPCSPHPCSPHPCSPHPCSPHPTSHPVNTVCRTPRPNMQALQGDAQSPDLFAIDDVLSAVEARETLRWVGGAERHGRH